MTGRTAQADFVRDVIKLFATHGFQVLATRFELLIDLDGFFGHLRVRVFGSADQQKIIPFGHAFVTIGIKSHPQEGGFCFGFLGIRHTAS